MGKHKMTSKRSDKKAHLSIKLETKLQKEKRYTLKTFINR